MALYGKCSNCGTYFMDAFGEFYDFDKQELICPICGSRNINDCESNEEDISFLSIFDVNKIEKIKKNMTKDELKMFRKDLELRESEIEDEMSQLSKEKHEIHVKMREYYQQYIDEHFPYKVGDKLRYRFVNRDGDEVTREIEVTEISGYKCYLSQIILFYKWNNSTGRIDYINIDGKLSNSSKGEKLEKI